MPPCPNIFELQAFADDQSGAADAPRVAGHVATCERCADIVRELKLSRLPLCALHEEPPPGLADRLLHALDGIQPLPAASCEQAMEWVSLRLDGELTHDQMQRLDAHLCACSTCYRAAAEMEIASEVLRGIETEPAPVGLLERVQAAAELADDCMQRKPRRSVFRRWATTFAGVAAAAAVFMAVLVKTLPSATHLPAPTVAVAPTIASPASPTVDVVRIPTVAPTPRPHTTSRPRTHTTFRREVVVAMTHPVEEAPAPPVAAPPLVPRPVVRPPAPIRPSAITVERTAPSVVAMAPSLPEVQPDHPTPDALAAPRAELAPTPRPAAPPAAPAPVVVEQPKPTPAVEPAPRRATAAAPSRSRSNWVSRPAAVAEREIYHSEDRTPRLADARSAVNRDVRTSRGMNRTPGYVIH